jgi:two-component system, NtrC family, sensor kinase
MAGKLLRNLLNAITIRRGGVSVAAPLSGKGRRMSLSARLILLLTIAVGVVMALGGYFILRQREEILARALRNELHAHAVTLRLTLEDSYRAGRIGDAQRLIDHLSENPRVFSVILFDEKGRVAMFSNPLEAGKIVESPDARRVIAAGEPAEFVRRRGGSEVYSFIMPIRISAARRGAFEISQPAEFIKADYATARRNIALITLALFAAIVAIVLLVMRHNLLRPIKELLGGAKAVGQGDLAYRVVAPSGGNEIAQLASEFNRMAESLAEQRRSAERQAEERLALERELRHSERLASVGRLAAGVAHEMGAPLNVIKGRVEMLRERPDAPVENRARNLDIIGAQADAITDIIRQLLTLARPFNLRREAIEPACLIAAVVELIEADAVKSGVMVEGPRNGHHADFVEGDQALLRQSLMNICINALHAMKQGGRLLIEVAPAETRGNGGTFVGLRVSDTGSGIPPENLAHIFDPFFTTKEVGKGTGLGLSVARRIVEEHDGWIEAANREEGGAAFTIWLPKVESARSNQRNTEVGSEAVKDEEQVCATKLGDGAFTG